MRLRVRHSPFVFVAIASFATALNLDDSSQPRSDSIAVTDERATRDIPTKNAPVDGQDGVPHDGPFIPTDSTDGAAKDDGSKASDASEGVMSDKNRERPLEGSTGLEGGVSEKEKARKEHEDITGEPAVTKPETPKEQPPLSHSEEEKIREEQGKSGSSEDDDFIPDVCCRRFILF
jgi:Ca2+/H+ antiporter, TMEM165/GDT1 family